jgi:NAD(P)-dependent dehydrogenase (short-subunit alcohol dehydrogenase family)
MGSTLDGKRVVVTGASRGLGRAYAHALAAEGARVVVNGTTAELVHAVAEEITSAGGEAVPCVASVASFEGARDVVAACVERWGGVDVVVNNAGVVVERMMFNLDEEQFRASLEVDCFGTFAVSRWAVRDMRPRGWGRIVNVGDVSAQTGLLGGTGVAAAKGAIHAMTYTWGAELARWGITANCVIPEAYTRLHDPLYRKAIEVARERGGPVPTMEQLIARAAQPEEITPFLVYLASEASGRITGQVFTMTKGRIALWSHAAEKAVVRFAHDAAPGALADVVGAEIEPHLEPVGANAPWEVWSQAGGA